MHSKLLILLVTGILAVPVTVQASPRPDDIPAQAEAAAVKNLLSLQRQQLVDLRTALAKAATPKARAALEEQLKMAKSSLEVRIAHIRLEFALKAGDHDRADRMLEIIQELERPLVPYAAATEDSTDGEMTE